MKGGDFAIVNLWIVINCRHPNFYSKEFVNMSWYNLSLCKRRLTTHTILARPNVPFYKRVMVEDKLIFEYFSDKVFHDKCCIWWQYQSIHWQRLGFDKKCPKCCVKVYGGGGGFINQITGTKSESEICLDSLRYSISFSNVYSLPFVWIAWLSKELLLWSYIDVCTLICSIGGLFV